MMGLLRLRCRYRRLSLYWLLLDLYLHRILLCNLQVLDSRGRSAVF
ncbi:hypothetical protein MCHI_000207 [Candidatus Magnetoovum chiemensis]|nr:hypothetical protein MCHI_000207 [Candidatus Magnetoovum chiemensis]